VGVRSLNLSGLLPGFLFAHPFPADSFWCVWRSPFRGLPFSFAGFSFVFVGCFSLPGLWG